MAPAPTAPRLLILGLPHFGRMLAAGLRARGWRSHYAAHPGRSLPGWLRIARAVAASELVYVIGGRIERRTPVNALLHVRTRPLVMHWVGTDALLAAQAARRGRGSQHIAERATHWCDAPWLADELAKAGVAAEYAPLPTPTLAPHSLPLPERFRALLYLPADPFDRGVFDVETLLRLPHKLPEIAFVVAPSPAATLPGELPPNVDARGWTDDIEALYREVSVYVRLTTHDGMSFMALEALSRGRYVIWTQPLEGAIRAEGLEDVAAALRGLAERHAAGDLGTNEEGARAVRERFDPEMVLWALEERLRGLLRTG